MSQLKITLIHSRIGQEKRNKRTITALGLRKLHQTRLLPDNDAVRGMVRKIDHLLKWEVVEEAAE